MSRLARLFVPGLPQIVTLRGNNRCIVFSDETDCRRYLEWLREAAGPEHVRVVRTCASSSRECPRRGAPGRELSMPSCETGWGAGCESGPRPFSFRRGR